MDNARVLRQVRLHPALWGECGPAKEAQAFRIRDKCKARLAPLWQARRDALEHERGQRWLQTWA